MTTPLWKTMRRFIAQAAALGRVARRQPAGESSTVGRAPGTHFCRPGDAHPTAAVDITREH
jgi:hypothetical protein